MQGSNLPMIDDETPTFMARPLVHTAEELKGADVVIIGSAYVAGTSDYAGVSINDWAAAAKRVRQQSCRYRSGYIQDFDIDVFEHLKVVDYGDAVVPESCQKEQTAESVLEAQANVEAKVNDALAVGAIPIVIGQNSPCSSYAIAKCISEVTDGNVGMVSLDTHWDSQEGNDFLTDDPRIAGSANWKIKTYEFLENFKIPNLVEIGERGMLENPKTVRNYVANGAEFIPMWRIRRHLGIEGVCEKMQRAYDGTDGVYVHFDMDVIGGAGPVGGDILGELAEPIGMTDYEVLRIANEVGLRGLTGMSFICIPPGSKLVYRLIVYVVMYLMAGLVEGGHARR
ncbi:MAG: agmatinase [Rhodospirillales bacterium]|nr:agmatinase [Rhodospirillales bacterium]